MVSISLWLLRRSQRIDLMPKHLDFALEHIAGSGRPGDRQPLPLRRKKSFEGEKESGCHIQSDAPPWRLFTWFDNIVSGTILTLCHSAGEK